MAGEALLAGPVLGSVDSDAPTDSEPLELLAAGSDGLAWVAESDATMLAKELASMEASTSAGCAAATTSPSACPESATRSASGTPVEKPPDACLMELSACGSANARPVESDWATARRPTMASVVRLTELDGKDAPMMATPMPEIAMAPTMAATIKRSGRAESMVAKFMR